MSFRSIETTAPTIGLPSRSLTFPVIAAACGKAGIENTTIIKTNRTYFDGPIAMIIAFSLPLFKMDEARIVNSPPREEGSLRFAARGCERRRGGQNSNPLESSDQS